jgi:hypothetical protein
MSAVAEQYHFGPSYETRRRHRFMRDAAKTELHSNLIKREEIYSVNRGNNSTVDLYYCFF